MMEGTVPMRRYTVVLELDLDIDRYSVVVPALPGCTSMGDTVDEALRNIREAIAGHAAVLEDLGQIVPSEPDRATVIVASVAA
jgi:predicted RNase H-like HicB family nuclease